MTIQASSSDWLLRLDEVRKTGEMLRIYPIGHLTYKAVVEAIEAQGFNADADYIRHRDRDTFYVIQHGNSVLIKHQSSSAPTDKAAVGERKEQP